MTTVFSEDIVDIYELAKNDDNFEAITKILDTYEEVFTPEYCKMVFDAALTLFLKAYLQVRKDAYENYGDADYNKDNKALLFAYCYQNAEDCREKLKTFLTDEDIDAILKVLYENGAAKYLDD